MKFYNTPEQENKAKLATSSKDELKIITMSGTEGVTKNMTVYECGEDIIVVDCGIGFPDSDLLGVDTLIPDMSYVFENKDRVRGLIITHGHEDHIGAVPYFLQELDVPVYATKLVQGFLTEKLKDKQFKGINQNVKFNLITPGKEEFEIGCFKISAFRVNHSVPSSVGFAIRTPQGLILHMADYKIDWTPVLDKPIDLGRIAELGSEGVLCLLSDCLGSTSEGYSKSEATLNDTFKDLFEDAKDRQILVTTISSNISRMYQIIEAAIHCGRKVCLAGRSIDQSVRVAKNLGYLPFNQDAFITTSNAKEHLQKDIVYIIAGCYGQQGSALDRTARSEHDDITLEDNALIVFSADPNPPGVVEDVEKIMDRLTLLGAEVIYSKIQGNLHVSGHGPRGDLIMVAAIAKPKYFIPIGGTVTKTRAYRNMLGELGIEHNRVFELLEGESVIFNGDEAKKGEKLELKQVYADGKTIGDVIPVVIRDREHLSSEGVFVVVIQGGKADVITRGFVYVKESKSLIGRSKDLVNKILNKNKGQDWGSLKHRIENDVERFLFKETGHRPMIIVHAVNIQV